MPRETTPAVIPRGDGLQFDRDTDDGIDHLRASLDLQNLSYAVAQGGEIGQKAARLLGERIAALYGPRDEEPTR